MSDDLDHWDDVIPIEPGQVKGRDDLARLTPRTIDDALECMKVALGIFHDANDRSAVFMRTYQIITRNVRDAIRGQNEFDNRIFFDPQWVSRLSGRFATLYFRSLLTFFKPPEVERAWKIAHAATRDKHVGVTQDVLLGINAHINYDLPLALYQNFLAHGDHTQASTSWLYRRKFDHDQVNNILMRSIPEVQRTLGAEYGGLLGLIGKALLTLDDSLSELGLKYYRERVWWDAVSFLAARGPDVEGPVLPAHAEFALVQQKLNWESGKLAEAIRDSLGPLSYVAALARRPRLGRFEPA